MKAIGAVGWGGSVGWASLVALMTAGATGCAGAQEVTQVQHPTLAAAIPADETAPADSPSTAPAEANAKVAESEDEPPPPEAVPTACGAQGSIGKGAELCMPARPYAKKVCGGIYPDLALGLFAKGTPWTRVYLAGDVEAWNASGGLTHRAKLAFDEEVIVLAKHTPGGSGGVVMTGMQASFDVIRWDGTCVSVMEGELTPRRPPAPKPADVPFSRLEESTRRALLATPKVKASYEAISKACSSVSTPAEKKACEKADRAFSQAIVDFVRGGGALPVPSRRP